MFYNSVSPELFSRKKSIRTIFTIFRLLFLENIRNSKLPAQNVLNMAFKAQSYLSCLCISVHLLTFCAVAKLILMVPSTSLLPLLASSAISLPTLLSFSSYLSIQQPTALLSSIAKCHHRDTNLGQPIETQSLSLFLSLPPPPFLLSPLSFPLASLLSPLWYLEVFLLINQCVYS